MSEGWSIQRTADHLGLATTTVFNWRVERATDAEPSDACYPCYERMAQPDAYLYVLGQYLGDGHLPTSGKTPVFMIFACTDYPGIIDEVDVSIAAVRGRPTTHLTVKRTPRLIRMQSVWKHWPCMLPQHGPGMKHTRPIVLADWQRELVATNPWPLIRGRIHSDGCRCVNRVTVRGKRYEYPRYFFSNHSTDIMGIFGTALDIAGVKWRMNSWKSMSIAGRDSVALMDEHIGPKT